MAESWQRWEGRLVDDKFPLRQYVAGTDHSAVFLTDGPDKSSKAAIKIIQADPTDQPKHLARWEQAAELSHPNLLRILGTGRCQIDGIDRLYVVSEYADENLAQILPSRALTPGEVKEMLPPILDALAYLHREGWVHAHLKPSNVMAIGDRLKLSTDGLRRAGESPTANTGGYIAPEVASGGAFSPASDVWALGATLTEALTQTPPTKAGSGEPDVPATIANPFREIVRNALRLEPQQRWTVREIQAHLAQQPPPAAEAPSVVEAPRAELESPPSARRRYVVPVGIAVLVLVALFVVPRFLNRPQEAQPSAVPASTQTTSAEPQAPAATPGAAPADAGPTKPSTGNVPGSVASRSLPEISHGARNTIQGHVKVRVRASVNAQGKVSSAKFESAGPSKYFANQALESAKRWTFVPPTVDGKPVASEWSIHYSFGRSGTDAEAMQVTPKK